MVESKSNRIGYEKQQFENQILGIIKSLLKLLIYVIKSEIYLFDT